MVGSTSNHDTRLCRLPTALTAGIGACLLLGVVACVSTPMRWERTGTSDASRDAMECRAAAHRQAIDELPYGNGPPLYGFSSDVSMLQWTTAIDNERTYLEADLTAACMRNRGFVLVPVPSGGG